MTVQVALNGNAGRFHPGNPAVPDPDLLFAFSPEAVPLKWPDALPISAERATRFVYDTLGVRVAEVPTLYTRGDIDATGTYDVQAGVASLQSLAHRSGARGGVPRRRARQRRAVSPRDFRRSAHLRRHRPYAAAASDVDCGVDGPRSLHRVHGCTAARHVIDVPVASPIRFELVQRAGSGSP